jgi:proteasome accessory factor PafA2
VSRLFGIETEYGILVEGLGAGDLVEESRQVVRAYAGLAGGPWDYRLEDPRRDMRGYRVDQLTQNPADAQYERPGTPRLSNEEERSDRVLANGARLYNDHGHPEYSTPECRTLRDLVAHDRAGERIVLECARRRSVASGRAISIFKNNTDFHGMSYGCHEGYLVPRDVPFEKLQLGLIPFFVTRQIYAGAGKTGVEQGGPFEKECAFQLSQRADFFTEEASVDTLHRRPIINTRDEPHADPHKFRRFHVIVGDANMSEFATALKVGTTALVLELIASGWEPLFRVRRPVDAIRWVSRDPALRWLVDLEDGRQMPAVELQRIYLSDCRRLLAGSDADADWTLRAWEQTLNALERDPFELEGRLDWVAKRRLLETYIEAENVWWEDETIRSLDLEYHNVDPEFGLYQGLEQAGQMERLTTDAEVEAAMQEAPADTRAWIRGEAVRRFSNQISRIGWGRVGLEQAGETKWLDLHALVDGEVAALNDELRTVDDPARWLELAGRFGGHDLMT